MSDRNHWRKVATENLLQAERYQPRTKTERELKALNIAQIKKWLTDHPAEEKSA